MDRNQTSSSANDQQRFIEHLERATEIVRSWPTWKQAVLGGLAVRQTACEQFPRGSETDPAKQ
jgi:hypothetical protein